MLKMIFFALLVFLLLFLFSNPLYVAISLIFSSLCLISSLSSLSSCHPLVGFLVLAVYIGAMMILIGYICAVCPNPKVYSSSFLFFSLSFMVFPIFLLLPSSHPSSSLTLLPPSSYFYSSDGVLVFFFIACFLFIVFLMVSSHFISPQAPLRLSNDS